MPAVRTTRPGTAAGFTLVEACVIVAVLTVVAFIALPSSSRAASAGSADAELRRDLQDFRRAVTVYAAQHGETPPGHPNGNTAQRPTVEVLAAQLTGWTDRAGHWSLQPNRVFDYGPYLRRIPRNAVNGLDSVRLVGPGRLIEAPGETAAPHGWAYQAATLIVRADAEGRDAAGVRYTDY